MKKQQNSSSGDRKTWQAHCWSNGDQSGPLIETHTANSQKYAPVLPTAATSSAWKSRALLLMLNHFLTKLLDHESCKSQQHIKERRDIEARRNKTKQNKTINFRMQSSVKVQEWKIPCSSWWCCCHLSLLLRGTLMQPKRLLLAAKMDGRCR